MQAIPVCWSGIVRDGSRIVRDGARIVRDGVWDRPGRGLISAIEGERGAVREADRRQENEPSKDGTQMRTMHD